LASPFYSDVLSSAQQASRLAKKGNTNPAYGAGLLAPGALNSSASSGAGASSAAPPASPSPASSITLKQTPQDYASQILNDPAFSMLKNSLSAQGISDAAHLRGAIQQALIQFGAVPNLPSDVLQTTGLDTAGTQTLADQNPFSTLKQLQQSYQDQQDAAKNQLAGRGILNSGETGYQLGRLGQQQGLDQYNATNSLLGNIGTLNDQYVAGRNAAAQALAQGSLTAEQTAAANGSTGTTATWDPATGLYRDPSGNYWNPDGTPGTPHSAPSPSAPAPPAPAAAPAAGQTVQPGVAPANIRTQAFAY
jgi:hypothetical protein